MIELTNRSGGRLLVHDEEQAKAWEGYGFRRQPSRVPAGDAPKGNASREEWARYAESLGVEFDEDAKRDEIKAAVEAARA